MSQLYHRLFVAHWALCERLGDARFVPFCSRFSFGFAVSFGTLLLLLIQVLRSLGTFSVRER